MLHHFTLSPRSTSAIVSVEGVEALYSTARTAEPVRRWMTETFFVPLLM